MTIDELTAYTRIDFPRPLALDESRNLFRYISQNMPAEIRYNVSYDEIVYFDEIIYPPGFASPEKRHSLKLKGSISRPISIGNYDCFESIPSEADDLQIAAIRFILAPGWSLGDYRKEVRQLWKDVRHHVNDYFEKSR